MRPRSRDHGVGTHARFGRVKASSSAGPFTAESHSMRTRRGPVFITPVPKALASPSLGVVSWGSFATRVRLWILTVPRYWVVQRWLSSFVFRVRLSRYTASQRGTAFTAVASTSGRLARLFLPALLVALASIAVLDWLASVALAIAPNIELVRGFGSRPSPEEYGGFLIATAAFGATLLGLFYTALSVVISTGYSRAPADVRSLLLNEQEGRVYTRAVGLFVAGSLLIIAATFLGYRPPVLTLAVVAVLSSTSVLALLVLGPRAFAFFDIAALGQPLRRKFDQWAERSARVNPDPAFERHFGQQASAVLDLYPMLIAEATAAGEAAADQLERIGHQLRWLWASYAVTKTRIPPNSFWYERQPAHRDWLAAEDLVLQPAVATGTGLPPEEVPDRLWVERRVAAALRTILMGLSRSGRGEGAYRLALSVSELTESLASAFQFDATQESLSVLTELVRPLASSHDPARAETLDRVLRYAIIDSHGLAVVGLILGLQRTSDHFAAPGLWHDVDRALEFGTDQTAPYLSAVLDYIEYLRQPLQFEIRVEGHQQTPRWFLRQLVARKLHGLVATALERTTQAIEQRLLAAADAADDPIAAAVFATRALEAIDKLQTHLPTTSRALDQFEAIRRSKDEFWPSRDDDGLRDRVRALHDRCFDTLSRLVLTVPEALDPSIPDFFGHAYTALVAESFDLLQTQRAERFRSLFPPLFLGGWRAYERVRASISPETADPRIQVIRLSGPVVDLMELSGYALLERELGSPEPWDACLKAWEVHFAAQSDPVAAAEQLIALVTLRDLPALLPGDLIRTARVQRFHPRLAEVVGADDLWDLGYGRRARHASPIIRAVAHVTLSHTEIVALFLNEVVVPRLPPGAQLPPAVRNVAESIALQSDAGSVDGDEDDDVW